MLVHAYVDERLECANLPQATGRTFEGFVSGSSTASAGINSMNHLKCAMTSNGRTMRCRHVVKSIGYL